MKLQEIKTAIAAGKTVHWASSAYIVKGNLIIHQGGHAIGLTWLDGVTLNGKESEFFIATGFDKFLHGYLIAMLWSSTDDEGEPLDNFELSDTARAKCEADCRAFIQRAARDLALYSEAYQPAHGYDVDECAGHDFWLTRAEHGAGFWDRGLYELGDRLTALCGYGTQFPPLDAYVGDDGLVYLS